MEQSFNRLVKAVTETGNPQLKQDIARARDLFFKSIDLLASCQAQVGMMKGEEIQAFFAELKKQQFNERDFHYERLPEGQ